MRIILKYLLLIFLAWIQDVFPSQVNLSNLIASGRINTNSTNFHLPITDLSEIYIPREY